MKSNHLFTSMLAVSALLVTSCSTSKLAKNNAIQDDVYNTTAQAKEYQEPAAPQQTTAKTDDDYYGTSDPYYDMDYSTRINRFYYANPWRTYYDSYYGYYSPFGFNNFYSPFYGNGFGWNSGYYSNIFSPYNYWGYYGAPYYNNYWGLYSYNNPYYYGGGGGYYGSIGGGIRNNANYGPRPTRGSENGINRANGSSYTGGSNGITDRTSYGGSRAERYNPTNNTGTTTSAGRNANTTSSTPTRSTTDNSRPTRSNDAPAPRPTYNPPVQQSSPPPSSGSRAESGSSSSGSSSSGSSSGGGGGRPTRGGGK